MVKDSNAFLWSMKYKALMKRFKSVSLDYKRLQKENEELRSKLAN